MPNMRTSASVRSPQTTSACGVGHPLWMLIACASGIARRTTSASAGVMRGRFATARIASSSKRPTRIGVRRTWKVLLPIIASAMLSFTYAFIPWITATTAMRNATDTMMPRSVKKLRSLLPLICANASARTSANSMREDYTRPAATRSAALFVAEGLDRIEARGAQGRDDAEEHAGERGADERGDDRAGRDARRHGRPGIDPAGDRAADHEAGDRADRGERRRLDEELPEDRALRGAERLPHADLAGALGDGDHHDRDDAHAADEQPHARERDHDHEEVASEPVERRHQLVLADDREVVD